MGGLMAKYRSDQQKQAEVKMAEFHFTSDLLEKNGASYTLPDWSDGFDIELYNYDKTDTKLISDTDITYKVTLSDTTKWKFSDSHNGEMKTSTGKEVQIIHVDPQPGVQENDEVTVTVKTIAPFTKTLTATFTMKGSKEPFYEITDQRDGTVLLTIKTNSYSDEVQVSWNTAQFDPDSTNPVMEKWSDAAGNGILSAEKNTTYELLFFKNTTENVAEKNGSGTKINLSE